MVPQRPVALSIPTDLYPLYIEDCSLLEQYPDLQVADSGRITHNLLRTAVSQHDFCIQSPISQVCPSTAQQEPQNSVPSIPDQGYLAMGDSVNISLDLPGSGLEPMSNSVLNGLLEKQLEEVYMQHLTENLARCNSHLGNSLLHGLVPPPQPSSQSEGPDSLLGCMEESTEDSSSKISYLNTHNLVPCSSNFSSPVLRISEAENPHPQWSCKSFKYCDLDDFASVLHTQVYTHTIVSTISVLFLYKALLSCLRCLKLSCFHMPSSARFEYYTTGELLVIHSNVFYWLIVGNVLSVWFIIKQDITKYQLVVVYNCVLLICCFLPTPVKPSCTHLLT